MDSSPLPVFFLMTKIVAVTALTRGRIYQAHTRDMGSPKHYIYPQGEVVYTLEGACALIDGLNEIGEKVAAASLAAEVAAAKARAVDAKGKPSADDEEALRLARRWDLAAERRAEDAA